MQLYFDVVSSAAEKLDVGIDDVRSLYAARHYAAYKCSIMDFGMYNCCTVTVEYRHEWNWRIFVHIPDGMHVKVHVDKSITPSELHDVVVDKAADYLDVRPDEIYSLYMDKAYNMFDNVSLVELGMHDGCTVTVYARLLGGVCVAHKACGKRKEVSNGATNEHQTQSYVHRQYRNQYAFRSMLERLRRGEVNHRDVELIRSRHISNFCESEAIYFKPQMQ
jgi:hypothetical protein